MSTRPRRHQILPQVTLRQALSDPQLLGGVLSGPSWKAWRVLLIAAMGERLTAGERAIFRELTHRESEPQQRVEEFVGVIGRRGGKSRSIAVIATYLSALCRHPVLAAGERGIVLVVAPDQRQADIVLDYCEATFRQSTLLRQLIETRAGRELRLTNGITIEVRALDSRRLRGPTYIAVIGDECAFWMTSENSANPDAEILAAVRPGLATTQGPLFLISSPYARRGELWRLYSRHFGTNGDPRILVAQGPSRTLNPTLPQSVIDRAMERDPASAAAEYLGQFRVDIESFVSLDAIQRCVAGGVYERAPERRLTYHAFCDPSGGSADAMTLAIGHKDHVKQTVIVDAVREVKPPFSPEAVVNEFAVTLKNHRISKVFGDRYAGEWPREQFSKFGIRYEPSAKSKSDLYTDLLPLINSARIELLDHPKLLNQLCGLERRVSRDGRDRIDHPPGAHDDLANVVAGLASINYGPAYDYTFSGFQPDADDADANAEWRQRRYAQFVLTGGYRRPW